MTVCQCLQTLLEEASQLITNACFVMMRETISHLFLHCPFARAVWHGSILDIIISNILHCLTKQWIVNCIILNRSMEQNEMCFLQTMFTILWTIWNHRNLVLHQGKVPNPMEVILTSQSLLCRYQEAFQQTNERWSSSILVGKP